MEFLAIIVVNRTTMQRCVGRVKHSIEEQCMISVQKLTLFIGTVNIDQLDSSRDKSWYSEIRVDNMPIRFKLDTGAEANVLPLKTFKSMKRKVRCERREHLQLQPTKTVLVAYGGMRLRPEGLLTLTCSTPKAHASLPSYISRHSSTPILGGDACEDLHLIKRLDINNLDLNHPTRRN